METAIRTQITARVGATSHAESLGTYCSPLTVLISIGQKMRQALTAGKYHETPYTGCKASRSASSFVMLVESDVRPGMLGILP